MYNEQTSLRTLVAGVLGGIAMSFAMLLTFRLIGFGWNGDGILITSPIQSAKLIAVWTKLEPLPLIITSPHIMIPGLVVFGVAHAFLYNMCSASWPAGIIARGMRLFAILFSIFAFWEFFTPFNQFGEPLALVLLELIFWAIIAVAESLVIVWYLER